MDLTELSLEDLMTVTVTAARTTPQGTNARTIAAIRAGCSNGVDICDALHAILRASGNREDARSNERAARTVAYVERENRPASVDYIEYNVPHREPGMYAQPAHMGFGRNADVAEATRALGLGSHERPEPRL